MASKFIYSFWCHGASPSAALQSALQASQATVSRVLASVSDEVIKLGAGRSSRYALAC
jgi:hypothetical protein